MDETKVKHLEYRLDLGPWGSVFAVPCALVDRHLKLAGKEQLQVILWTLRRGEAGFSPKDAAQALGIPEAQAEEALEYWVQQGLLAAAQGALTPRALPETTGEQNRPTAGQEPPKAPPRQRMVKPDAAYLARRVQESAAIRSLLQEAELTLGILSPAMTNVILAGCDDYGLPPEVLLMLLHYARDVGKTGTAYIESVIRDWSSSGVFTLEAAEAKLQELSEKRLAWGVVASAAGLPKRSPTKKEEEAAYRWVREWGFSREMVAAAYERCADNTGKFSVAYMNRVLERWRKENLRTVADVTEAEAKKSNAKTQNRSYQQEDLENLSFFDLPEEL